MNKDVLVYFILIFILCVAIWGMFFITEMEYKTVESNVVDVETFLNNDNSIDYFIIHFEDGTIVKARTYGVIGSTLNFVKNSNVIISFSRSKHLHDGYWNIAKIIKVPGG